MYIRNNPEDQLKCNLKTCKIVFNQENDKKNLKELLNSTFIKEIANEIFYL